MKIQHHNKGDNFIHQKPFSDNSYSPAKTEVGSKILLAMIQNERNYTISHEFLYSLFKNYGDVRKVFIKFL